MESQGPRFFCSWPTWLHQFAWSDCRCLPFLTCALSALNVHMKCISSLKFFCKTNSQNNGNQQMVSFLISSTSFSFQTKKIWMIHVWLNIIASVYPHWTVSHFYHLYILTGSERVLSLSKGLIFVVAPWHFPQISRVRVPTRQKDVYIPVN